MSNDLRPYDPDPLSIRDTVRVRLSGECPGPRSVLHGGRRREHWERMNGRTGHVSLVSDDGLFRDHPYVVVFGAPTTYIGFYARTELERA